MTLDSALILFNSAAAIVALWSSICATNHMSRKTPLAIRLAFILIGVGAAAALLAPGYLGRAPFHRWDLVLADPPYPLENEELARMLSLLVGRLGPGGVIAVERSARTGEPAWPKGLRRFETSEHGETVIWYLEADEESATATAQDAAEGGAAHG